MKKKALRALAKESIAERNIVPHGIIPSITIILVQTETGGNIGSVCRVMKNFCFEKLILFNPIADPQESTIFGYAMHGDQILKQAEIIRCDPSKEILTLRELFHRFDLVIGTSAKGIEYNNITRTPQYLEEFNLENIPSQTKIGLVFGRESTGLTNEQISLTDFCLRIPANPNYTSLNLSHAVGIILYQCFISASYYNDTRGLLASKEEKDRLIRKFSEIVSHIDLRSDDPKPVIMAFKNLLGRALLSKTEFDKIFGVFFKIQKAIHKMEEKISKN